MLLSGFSEEFRTVFKKIVFLEIVTADADNFRNFANSVIKYVLSCLEKIVF